MKGKSAVCLGVVDVEIAITMAILANAEFPLNTWQRQNNPRRRAKFDLKFSAIPGRALLRLQRAPARIPGPALYHPQVFTDRLVATSNPELGEEMGAMRMNRALRDVHQSSDFFVEQALEKT